MSQRVERPERVLWRPDEIENFDEELESILWIKSAIEDLSKSVGQHSLREATLLQSLKLSLGRAPEELELETERAKTLPCYVSLSEDVEKLTQELNRYHSQYNWMSRKIDDLTKARNGFGWMSILLGAILLILVAARGKSTLSDFYNQPFKVEKSK